MYMVRARLPISYRVWNAISAFSLLVYSDVLDFNYEIEYTLREMHAATNGPFLATYRVNSLSTIYILPTAILAAIVLSVFFVNYLVYKLYKVPSSSKTQKKSSRTQKSNSHNIYHNNEESEGTSQASIILQK